MLRRIAQFARFKLFARIAISALLLFILFSQLDYSAVRQSAERAAENWKILLVAIIVPPLIGFLISAARWQSLLNAHGFDIGIRRVLRTLLVSAFFNKFLPSSVGGDAYRVWAIGKAANSMSAAAASVVIDRIFGVLALVLLALVGCALRPGWYFEVPALQLCIPLLILAFIFGIAFVLLVRPPGEGFPMVGTRIGQMCTRFAGALAYYRTKPITLVSAAGYSILLQTNVVIQFWAIGLSLGLESTMDRFLVAVPLATLASLLPLSINGLGIREWVMILVCTPLGISQADAAVVSLLFVVSSLLLSVPGAVILARSSVDDRLAIVASSTLNICETTTVSS